MKKSIVLPLFIGILIFSACEELGDLVPDVDKTVSETYEITINENVPIGITEVTFIDVNEYEEFQAYAEYLEGYLINKISYEILDDTIPEDLFFTGTIEIFGEDSTNVLELGEIASINLTDVADMATEQDVTVDTEVAEQLVSWLEETGTFSIQFRFAFKDSEGNDYEFAEEDLGSGFTFKSNVYLTLLTGLGDFEPTV
ncbi:MAG: hypothetical protein K9J30_09380 [Bacteroidales bacterium]|nr:hypothetical protein [Bacteroidales bacterium]